MNIKELCQKLADNSETLQTTTTYPTSAASKIISADIIKVLNDNCTLSDDIQTTIASHQKPLLIIDKNINVDLLLTVLNLVKTKQYKIILASYARKNITLDDYRNIFATDVFDSYKSSFIEYDINDATQFDFFGSTRYKSAILLHKSFLASDLIIPIGEIKYDILYGFTGGKSMIFTGIAHKKSTAKFASLIIDEQHKKINSAYKLTNLSDNIISDDSSGATLIARSEVTYFAINYISTPKGEILNINSGDLFVSHIEMTKIFDNLSTSSDDNNDKPDHGAIRFTNSCLQDIVPELYMVIEVMKNYADGSLILIEAKAIKTIGSKDFIDALAVKNTAELIESLKTDFNYDILLAFVLKYLTAKHNLWIDSNLDIKTLEQSGFKIVNETESNTF